MQVTQIRLPANRLSVWLASKGSFLCQSLRPLPHFILRQLPFTHPLSNLNRTCICNPKRAGLQMSLPLTLNSFACKTVAALICLTTACFFTLYTKMLHSHGSIYAMSSPLLTGYAPHRHSAPDLTDAFSVLPQIRLLKKILPRGQDLIVIWGLPRTNRSAGLGPGHEVRVSVH